MRAAAFLARIRSEGLARASVERSSPNTYRVAISKFRLRTPGTGRGRARPSIEEQNIPRGVHGAASSTRAPLACDAGARAVAEVLGEDDGATWTRTTSASLCPRGLAHRVGGRSAYGIAVWRI